MKDTPKKDTPKKGEQTPGKKILMPDKSTEPLVKKQWTSSPSSDRGSETNHGKTDKSKKKKKRKKKELKSEPTVATDSKTEEQQEKCQQARKWKVELQVLKDYCESHNIFLHNLPEWGSCSHTGYLGVPYLRAWRRLLHQVDQDMAARVGETEPGYRAQCDVCTS